jgi:hypothetical protein
VPSRRKSRGISAISLNCSDIVCDPDGVFYEKRGLEFVLDEVVRFEDLYCPLTSGIFWKVAQVASVEPGFYAASAHIKSRASFKPP